MICRITLFATKVEVVGLNTEISNCGDSHNKGFRLLKIIAFYYQIF
jgi:hypothetical protein